MFRAEPHDTARHLAQYTSLDVELGFIDDHRDVMAVLRDVVAGMVDAVARAAAASVAVPAVPAEIPAVHFAEALKIAGAPADEPDLAPAHERALGEWALREHGIGLPVRHRLPDGASGRSTRTRSRAARRTRTGSTCCSAGWSWSPAGSGCTGTPTTSPRCGGRPRPAYESYVEAFRHGMPPHGGFAIGLERFVARLLGAANVREVTAFPRDLHRLTP